jgi:hypothetical protein
MSWLVHHTQSERYASQAEELSRRHEGDRAAELYRLAADTEVNALESLDPSKTRTIGITVVSAASLYFKAQEFSQAKKIAHKWLATDLLPAFAVDELEDLLQAIRYEESRLRSGMQFSKPEPPESVEYRVTSLRGTLRNLHLDDDWIEISIDGETKKIYDAGEAIDNRVGIMVNRRVVAEVVERSDRSAEKRYSLRDLQLEEDVL